jgi:Peptidase family M50
MSKLGKFLSWCFGLEALCFLPISLIVLWTVLTNILRPAHPGTASLTVAKAVVVAALFMLLACAPLFGMAWWTTWKGKASAQGWAIAASVTNTILGLAPALLSKVSRFAEARRVLGGPGWLLVAGGVAGLVVFSRREVMAQMGVEAARPPRLPGDGTSRLVDTLARFAGIGVVLAGLAWWDHWAHARGLRSSRGAGLLLLIVLADLISVSVHELGHTAAGLALGMKLRSLTVGPFRWGIRNGRWEFQFQPASFLAADGRTGLVHTSPGDPRWWDVCMIAAGPIASLGFGLLALWAALTAKGRPWEQAWELLAFIAVISLLSFVINLIPIRPEADYSDGARIYQLLSGGPWADVHRAFSIAASSLVTPLRPRDYDIGAVQRAARFVTHGNRGLVLRLLAYLHFFDCGRVPEATQAMAEAEAVYAQSALEIPPEVHSEFVFGNAFLKRDATGARLWWDRMEAGKPRRDGVDYWLARSALLWIENCPKEAREALDTGSALARKLPTAGAYEFDRDRFTQLRQAFDASSWPA